MVTIYLTDEDVIRLKVIDIDRDSADALAFIKERIIPEIKKQESSGMRRHLDTGGTSTGK